jgi:hypothetical protein
MATPARTQDIGAPSSPVARTVDPYQNPSYPTRVHLNERAALDDVLRACDQRLNAAFQKLSVLASHAQKPLFGRLYSQMQGARDQVAEAVRRLPMEVGGLYHEDHERLEQAKAAIERTWRRWEKAGA